MQEVKLADGSSITVKPVSAAQFPHLREAYQVFVSRMDAPPEEFREAAVNLLALVLGPDAERIFDQADINTVFDIAFAGAGSYWGKVLKDALQNLPNLIALAPKQK